jgi:hypothetical protein
MGIISCILRTRPGPLLRGPSTSAAMSKSRPDRRRHRDGRSRGRGWSRHFSAYAAPPTSRTGLRLQSGRPPITFLLSAKKPASNCQELQAGGCESLGATLQRDWRSAAFLRRAAASGPLSRWRDSRPYETKAARRVTANPASDRQRPCGCGLVALAHPRPIHRIPPRLQVVRDAAAIGRPHHWREPLRSCSEAWPKLPRPSPDSTNSDLPQGPLSHSDAASLSHFLACRKSRTET